MALTLHQLKPKKGSRKTIKRVGRGLGSKGTYSGRGTKGQRARSGGRSGLQLKGLRKIMLSTPKQRGFTSQYAKAAVVNLSDLARKFAAGEKVTVDTLHKKGLIRNTSSGAKILGKGALAIKLSVEGCAVSASAREAIEKAGGSIK